MAAVTQVQVGRPISLGFGPAPACAGITTDLFGLGYEAVGAVDARLETIAEWKTPFRDGTIYHHAGHRIRAVLLWKGWDQVEAARRMIIAGQPAGAEALHSVLAATA